MIIPATASASTVTNSLFQHSSKAVQNKSRILMVMFAILFTCMLIFHIYCDDNFLLNRNVRIFNFEKRSFNKKNVSEMKQTNDFLIKQKGCRIPAMFTFGPLVEPYLDKASPVTCDVRTQKTNTSKSLKIWKPALFHDEDNILYVNRAALKYYGKGNLHCEYEEFFRSKPSNDSNEDYYDGDVVYKGAKKMVNSEKRTEIGDDVEFIRVQCVRKKKSRSQAQEQKPVYEDFFAFAPLKREVETRCEKHGGGGKSGQSSDTISVMVVALDALSRLNFHRQMKLSSQYLKQEMKAIEMLGYNKVGDNTFPNFIPMFAGVSVDELKKKCWKSDNDYFDKCSFVWQKFQQRGYRTNFAEEAANIGVFHYIKKGFRHQPTDYYFRPFNTEAEKRIGHHKPANTALCVGARLNLAVLLDYAAKFGRKFSSKKYFGLFWSSSYTHDWFSLASEGDKAVLNFLRNVNKNNVLKNTALVFISDHGLRWGSFRETFQGHLEERLPMLWFVLPRWFQRKYRKAVSNLRENARKLTTPFDLYETLNDFANLTRIRDKAIDLRSRSRSSSPSSSGRQRQRQTSLFLPVPESRTCSDAGIPKHFCACHNDVRAISKNDSTVVKAANQIVRHINSLVKKHSACSQLRLQSIVSASIERTSMSEKFSSNTSRNDFESNYTITVKTTPGNGLFEATVRYEPAQHLLLVIGSVSRLNMYGSQGKCVNDSLLRLYCYCRII